LLSRGEWCLAGRDVLPGLACLSDAGIGGARLADFEWYEVRKFLDLNVQTSHIMAKSNFYPKAFRSPGVRNFRDHGIVPLNTLWGYRR
jgi:hypothetical protein